MEISFTKYQGTGNDFIMIDNRKAAFPAADHKLIAAMCNRRLGIGADGLILIEDHQELDFKMVYFNADGNPGSMCGNGGRCAMAFAADLAMVGDSARFEAADGVHEAEILKDGIRLSMNNVELIRTKPNYVFLDTGSPHHVQMVDDLDSFEVGKEGARLRYGLYGEKGSNINFVEVQGEEFAVRTYERGVEDETLSCGTGVTAVALAMHQTGRTNRETVGVRTRGGELRVSFKTSNGVYTDIYLEGPVAKVFEGDYIC